jgi:Protein of unknown function (DUF2695)
VDASDRERKKKWTAHERAAARAAFPLSDHLLQSLFDVVEASVADQGCDHTRRFTEQWLRGHPDSRERVITWLEENGGFCDCEVAANAADYCRRSDG